MNRIRKLSLILVPLALLLTTAPAAAGDSAGAAPRWTIYKPTNTGLPGDYVYGLDIDSRGRVWIGSDDPIWDEGGLSRFDGSLWQTWTNVDRRSPTHFVHHVTVDDVGAVWMASDIGLLKLQGKKVRVVWSMANAPWPTNQVTDFDWDSQGNLWVALSDVITVKGGLAKYDGAAWTVYTTGNGLPWDEPWDSVSAVEVDAEDRVWLGSDILGGAMFDGTNWIWMREGWVTDIVIAPDGTPWYGFSSTGVKIWDGIRWVDRTGNFGTQGIPRVVLDREGKIWISTYIGTIWRWNGSRWDTSYVVPNLSHIYGLDFDAANQPWAGGIGGLAARQPDGTWDVYTTQNTGLPSRWVDDVFVDSTGAAWFSTGGGGLAEFDGRRWIDYNPNNWGTAPWPFLTDSANQTLEDRSGTIWTTPMFHGVGEWDGSQWVEHLPFYDIESLTLDATGAVWAAPTGGQVLKWTGSEWQPMGNPSSGQINWIHADALGNVWVATITGLMKYDGSSWTVYTKSNSGLPDNYVRAVASDSSGVIWVGTANGLARFDGASWNVYTTGNSGLPADNISSVDIAPDGDVWAGAFDGDVWPYEGGVAGFDGDTWTTFTDENSPLPHEQVEGIDVDVLGNVWVATASEGAARISGV